MSDTTPLPLPPTDDEERSIREMFAAVAQATPISAPPSLERVRVSGGGWLSRNYRGVVAIAAACLLVVGVASALKRGSGGDDSSLATAKQADTADQAGGTATRAENYPAATADETAGVAASDAVEAFALPEAAQAVSGGVDATNPTRELRVERDGYVVLVSAPTLEGVIDPTAQVAAAETLDSAARRAVGSLSSPRLAGESGSSATVSIQGEIVQGTHLLTVAFFPLFEDTLPTWVVLREDGTPVSFEQLFESPEAATEGLSRMLPAARLSPVDVADHWEPLDTALAVWTPDGLSLSIEYKDIADLLDLAGPLGALAVAQP